MTEQMDQRPSVRRETGLPTERRRVIVATLQEQGPLTCVDLLEFLPAFTIILEWPCPNPHWHDESATCVHARQEREWHPGYSNTYADLRKLEDEGQVVRGPRAPRRSGVGKPASTWMAYSMDDEEADAIASILEAVR